MPIIAKRCGIKFDPPSVILIYKDEHTNKLRKRVIPVRSFSQFSGNRLSFLYLVTLLVTHDLSRLNMNMSLHLVHSSRLQQGCRETEASFPSWTLPGLGLIGAAGEVAHGAPGSPARSQCGGESERTTSLSHT